jgi:hypothetical protein
MSNAKPKRLTFDIGNGTRITFIVQNYKKRKVAS